MKILITSGGTRVTIDSVRYIGNMSSGRTGADLAFEAINRGHEVTFFTSKDGKRPLLTSYKEIVYLTYEEYKQLLLDEITYNHYDVIISCAAVSDYTVVPIEGKISDDEVTLKLVKTEKVLPLIKQVSPKSFVVGYKLLVDVEIDELCAACDKQIREAKVDLVVGNDLHALRNNYYYQLLFTGYNSHTVIVDNFSSNLFDVIEGKI